MAGAIAGTAILGTEPNRQFQVITLTVNNRCNLSCGHCYLQNGRDNRFVDDVTIERVLDSSPDHVAIVGKEPLVDVEKTSALIQKLCKRDKNYRHKQVSMITNGLLLQKMDKRVLELLQYIDVSMDGGPKTYSRGDYASILNNLRLHPKINVLHTIYEENMGNINDMLDVPVENMLFSPYIVTQNNGRNTVTRGTLLNIIDAFDDSKIREHPFAKIGIDMYHVKQDDVSFDELEKKVKDCELEKNVLFFRRDPLEYGIVRVTYDGMILSPRDSLHPKE